MCIGRPVRILSCEGIVGRTEAGEAVDLSLTGPVETGTWVLEFLGAARGVLTPEEAALIAEALDGLASVMAGHGPGGAFSDLTGRAPALPPHLEAARAAGRTVA